MTNLKCTGMNQTNCQNAVTKIDNKGFIYCKDCGTIRRLYAHYGMKVRQLKPNELKLLENNRPITKY